MFIKQAKLIGKTQEDVDDLSKAKKLWFPDLQVQHADDLSETSNTFRLQDTKTGHMKQSLHYQGTLLLIEIDPGPI